MLRGIRKASENWLGRAVMGVVMTLLAGSFAVWGINDIFRGFGRSSLAKVGDIEITTEQFRQTYNDRLQQLGQQVGKPVTSAQAAAFGLDRQVLSEMIAQSALDQRARQMRLGISDADVSRRITGNPQFQTPGGAFDRERFEDTLRNAGFTEQRFVNEQRGLTLRQQIINSISGNIQIPNTLRDAINQYQNETRGIAYLALGPAQAGDIAPPTDEELGKYFDARKIMFRAPEYRKITAAVATPEDLAKSVEVSDDEVKKIFDAYRNRYITPERRRVEQMVFPSMAEAQAASEKIKAGTSFSALAAERGLKEQDLDLGTVAKSTIIDPAVADAAFALKVGEVSAPVQGRFGAVIVTVTNIVPEEDKTFADVAPQIRHDIALARTKQMAQSIHDKMEDERAGGSSVEQAAKKLNLPVRTFDIDRSGHDPSGQLAADLPHASDVINAAFASDVGVDNDPIEADGGYIWYEVAAITPARDRTLDEVKSQVEQHWRNDEIANRLKVKAADILDKLKGSTPLDALAAANSLKVQSAGGIKRGEPLPVISARTIDAIFHTAKDGFGSAEGEKPTDWIVFNVTAVNTPPFDANSEAAKKLDQTLQREWTDDVFGQYMAWVEDELGTRVDQSVLAQALSNGAPDTN